MAIDWLSCSRKEYFVTISRPDLFPRLAPALLLAVAGFSTEARADDDVGPYMAAEAGISFSGNQHLLVRQPTAAVVGQPIPTADIRTETGLELAVQGGYDFGPVRAEVEYSWRRANIDSASSTALLPTRFNTPPAAPTTTRGSFPDATGRVRTRAVMANLLADLPLGERIELFGGGGVGHADVRVARFKVSTNATAIDDGDSGFAWQAIAGARFLLSDEMSLTLKYNYLHAGGIDLVDTLHDQIETVRHHHSLRAGVSFRF